MNRIITVVTCLLASVLVGAGVVHAIPAASDESGSRIDVPLGRPVFAQALYYTELFDEKPFAEAILLYRDNGSYTILSPGEDHHGSFVADTSLPEPPQEVRFLSWPSSDWNDDVAAHDLVFTPSTGAFSQHLTLPGTSTPLLQYGYSAALDEAETIDPTDGWDALRQRYRAVFDELAERGR